MNLTQRLKLMAQLVSDNAPVWTLDTSKWTKRMWKKYGRYIYD